MRTILLTLAILVNVPACEECNHCLRLLMEESVLWTKVDMAAEMRDVFLAAIDLDRVMLATEDEEIKLAYLKVTGINSILSTGMLESVESTLEEVNTLLRDFKRRMAEQDSVLNVEADLKVDQEIATRTRRMYVLGVLILNHLVTAHEVSLPDRVTLVIAKYGAISETTTPTSE